MAACGVVCVREAEDLDRENGIMLSFGAAADTEGHHKKVNTHQALCISRDQITLWGHEAIKQRAEQSIPVRNRTCVLI